MDVVHMTHDVEAPCDSRWAAGDEAVGSWEKPPLRYDWGAAHMSIGEEVKADLPGPLSQLGVLPSNDAVQLVGPGATIWYLTQSLMRGEGKLLSETEMNVRKGKNIKRRLNWLDAITMTPSLAMSATMTFWNPN